MMTRGESIKDRISVATVIVEVNKCSYNFSLTFYDSWLRSSGMGRKRLPDRERREKPLRIRLADEERELIDRAATAASSKSSAWARAVLLKAAQRQLRRR